MKTVIKIINNTKLELEKMKKDLVLELENETEMARYSINGFCYDGYISKLKTSIEEVDKLLNQTNELMETANKNNIL